MKHAALPVFVIDAGNAFVKWAIGDIENSFVHKIALLAPGDYERALTRYGRSAALDFIRIDGQDYAVGRTAEDFHVQHRTGAPKYKRDYYGVLFASAVARTFASQPELLKGGLSVMASHASRDYEFHKQLIASIKGNWKFESGGVKFSFSVSDVQTYEEPFGGYARCAFVKTKRGWTTPLYGKSVGIIDIGGGTCGVLVVDENGFVKYGSAESGSQGINNVITRLRSSLKLSFPDFFQNTPVIAEDRLRQALATGIYTGGGTQFDVSGQVVSSVNPLLNEVTTMYYDKLGGGAALDVVILTGGGNAVLGELVKSLLNHGAVLLADDPSSIQFANVRGARDFASVVGESI